MDCSIGTKHDALHPELMHPAEEKQCRTAAIILSSINMGPLASSRSSFPNYFYKLHCIHILPWAARLV